MLAPLFCDSVVFFEFFPTSGFLQCRDDADSVAGPDGDESRDMDS